MIFVMAPWFDDDPPPPAAGEFTQAVQAAALENQLVYLDSGQPLFDRADLISPDGVHPNAAGYQALAAAVTAVLDPQLAP